MSRYQYRYWHISVWCAVCPLKNLRKLEKSRKRSKRPKNYLQQQNSIWKSNKNLKRGSRDTSGPSADHCSPKHHQKWIQWKGSFHFSAWQYSQTHIIEAVWNHLESEQNKRQPTSKKEFWMSFRKPGELYLKTTWKNYKKACLRAFLPDTTFFTLCYRHEVLF